MSDQFTDCTKHFCIIGMPKCGTVSLQTYLKERFPGQEAVRVEQIWKPDFVEKVATVRPKEDWHYVIILRDNIDRIWSSYYYFEMNKQMSLAEYLNYDIHGSRLGIANPIKQGMYSQWVDVWRELKPIVVTLEEMREYEGFPHENKTGERREYPSITEADRKLITSYLDKCEMIVNG